MSWKKGKEYVQAVCMIYTCGVIGKVIVENVQKTTDLHYGRNLLVMFLITCFATAVLASYEKLQRFPLIPVVIGQYVFVIGIVLGGVFLAQKTGITQVDPGGYRDLFLSVTVPYSLGAIIYYVIFFMDIKKANQMIQVLQKTETNNRKF